MSYKLYCEDCRTTCAELRGDSIDTIITDPPYGLKFMGKDWDKGVPNVGFWRSFLRVAKPGAMLLAFGGSRTEHRLTSAIEDAGWRIRDKILWLYGSGFPKSFNLGEGYGTALKPAAEYITLAMKPLEKGVTFAQNLSKWGVGGLWIDGARVGTKIGRWPANVILSYPEDAYVSLEDRSYISKDIYNRLPEELQELFTKAANPGKEEVEEGFPECRGVIGKTDYASGTNKIYAPYIKVNPDGKPGTPDSGLATRFFYCAKVSRKERGPGNNHPTMKPIALMEYLCKLTRTPTGGTVFDPFMGTGTTGIGCALTGRDFVGCETDAEHFTWAEHRVEEAYKCNNR